jgi:hypothetical protein
MHVLAGLKKGDSISISRESLPGAVLFPGIKYKEVKEPSGAGQVEESEKGKVSSTTSDAGDMKSDSASTDEAKETSLPTSTSTSSLPFVMPQSPTQVHRFLVVTRERFIVLDSGGSGIGSTAIVKSNHHLTEVTLYNPSLLYIIAIYSVRFIVL